MDNIPNLKYKTTLCLSWAQGIFCEKAEGCYFAHGQGDLRTIEQNREAVASRNKAHLYNRPPQNYKTIFCRFYGKGECKLGDACTYAHERRQKKIRKANTISYEMEHQYALYAYYAQLNPWIQHYTAYPPQSFSHPQQSMQMDPTNEEMKMSSETVPSEREASTVEKMQKQSQSVGKVVLMQGEEQVGKTNEIRKVS